MNVYTYENVTVCIGGEPFAELDECKVEDWQVEEAMNGRR